jgi:prephenate dehydratase
LGKIAIAFQGEHGAYSEEAIYKRFGKAVTTVPTTTIREVFDLAEAGNVRLGVVPVENSVEGSINETYDMLVSHNLTVVGEVILRVVHCLIALDTARLEDIKVVYSHPQALAQCRNFVRSMGLEPIVTYDTAGSAKMIKEDGLLRAAAIAGERAAQIYGLKVLKKGIEDYSTNSTRFLVVSKERGLPGDDLDQKVGSGRPAMRAHSPGGQRADLGGKTGYGRSASAGRRSDRTGPRRARQQKAGGAAGEGRTDKTSIIFALPHTPGSLYNALEVFARANINLTKIESRPTKQRVWEYYFFVDFEGNEMDTTVAVVLDELSKKTVFLKILGSYPRSEPGEP